MLLPSLRATMVAPNGPCSGNYEIGPVKYGGEPVTSLHAVAAATPFRYPSRRRLSPSNPTHPHHRSA